MHRNLILASALIGVLSIGVLGYSAFSREINDATSASVILAAKSKNNVTDNVSKGLNELLGLFQDLLDADKKEKEKEKKKKEKEEKDKKNKTEEKSNVKADADSGQEPPPPPPIPDDGEVIGSEDFEADVSIEDEPFVETEEDLLDEEEEDISTMVEFDEFYETTPDEEEEEIYEGIDYLQ